MKKNKILQSLNFYNVKIYNNVCCVDHKIMKPEKHFYKNEIKQKIKKSNVCET